MNGEWGTNLTAKRTQHKKMISMCKTNPSVNPPYPGKMNCRLGLLIRNSFQCIPCFKQFNLLLFHPVFNHFPSALRSSSLQETKNLFYENFFQKISLRRFAALASAGM